MTSKPPKDFAEANEGVPPEERLAHLKAQTYEEPVPPSPRALEEAARASANGNGNGNGNAQCNAKAAAAAPRTLTLRTPQEILDMSVTEADLILKNGYLAFGERACMCGVGKSRLAMQLAICTRLGRPFLGWETNGRELRWLFLQTENSIRRLKQELHAMFQPLTPEERAHVSAGIHVHTLEQETDGLVYLNRPDSLQAVANAIERSGADVVVFDPLRDFTTGDLNKDADMAEVLALITTTVRKGNPRRVPFVLHHAGTGRAGVAKATGYDRSSFGRNSKVLHGWARSQTNVVPARPNDNTILIIASGKCSNAEEFKPFAAELNPATLMYERLENFDIEGWMESVSGCSPGRPKKAQAGDEELLQHVPHSRAIEKGELLARCQETGLSVRAFRSLLDDLLEREELHLWEEFRSGRRPLVKFARFAQPSGDSEGSDDDAEAEGGADDRN
jgi:hypothetical protein